MTSQGLSPRLQKLSPLTDDEVIDRIVDGDTAAFELLMRRHNQRLFRLARSVVGTDSEAEDVVQESFYRAYGALARFEGRSSVVTWLSRIVFHESLRVRRKKRRLLLAEPADLDRMHPTDGLGGSASEGIEYDETRKMLAAALDELPASSRSVVMLRLIEELSTRDTAASLRMSESNVKVTLHRAKQKLAQSLQQHAIDELREHFTFAGDRCNRIVSGVFARIDGADGALEQDEWGLTDDSDH